jgi:hypothetical protein
MRAVRARNAPERHEEQTQRNANEHVIRDTEEHTHLGPIVTSKNAVVCADMGTYVRDGTAPRERPLPASDRASKGELGGRFALARFTRRGGDADLSTT